MWGDLIETYKILQEHGRTDVEDFLLVGERGDIVTRLRVVI